MSASRTRPLAKNGACETIPEASSDKKRTEVKLRKNARRMANNLFPSMSETRFDYRETCHDANISPN